MNKKVKHLLHWKFLALKYFTKRRANTELITPIVHRNTTSIGGWP